MNVIWHDISDEYLMQFQFSCLPYLKRIFTDRSARHHLVNFALDSLRLRWVKEWLTVSSLLLKCTYVTSFTASSSWWMMFHLVTNCITYHFPTFLRWVVHDLFKTHVGSNICEYGGRHQIHNSKADADGVIFGVRMRRPSWTPCWIAPFCPHLECLPELF